MFHELVVWYGGKRYINVDALCYANGNPDGCRDRVIKRMRTGKSITRAHVFGLKKRMQPPCKSALTVCGEKYSSKRDFLRRNNLYGAREDAYNYAISRGKSPEESLRIARDLNVDKLSMDGAITTHPDAVPTTVNGYTHPSLAAACRNYSVDYQKVYRLIGKGMPAGEAILTLHKTQPAVERHKAKLNLEYEMNRIKSNR